MKIKYNEEDLVDHHGIAAIIKYGFWTIPVGKVKKDQSVIDGLKLEILEECNLIIQECKEIIYKDYFYQRNSKNVKVSSHVYEILKYTGELKNMEPMKHRKQLFMSIEEIKQLPYLSDITLLYLSYIGFNRNSHL